MEEYISADGGIMGDYIFFAYLYFILFLHCILLYSALNVSCILLNINKIKSYLLMSVKILIDRTSYSKMSGMLNSIHRSCQVTRNLDLCYLTVIISKLPFLSDFLI